MGGRVLLPIDGSEASLNAFIPARSIAELLGLSLCILYVTENHIDKNALLEKLKINKEELDCFILSQVSGDPASIVIEEAEKSRFVVMGTHGETCNESVRLGSVTAKVVEGVSKPIMLIRPRTTIKIDCGKWTPQKALIPLNGAPNSSQALAPVIELLAETKAEINLLHIMTSNVESLKGEGAYSAPYYEDYQHFEWASWSDEFIKRFCPKLSSFKNITTNVSLAMGDPADQIITYAIENKNDFIAIAWHGYLSHLRAKVLKKVLLNACCPVMLVKIK